MKNEFRIRVQISFAIGFCCLFSLMTGCGLFGGGGSSENEVSQLSDDPQFNTMVIRATDHVKNGRYELAENVYDQALRRAMRLDLRVQVPRVVLTLAAFRLDHEDVPAAKNYLGLLKGIQIEDQDAALRAADLQFRLARLSGDPAIDRLRDDLKKKLKGPHSETKNNVYRFDAKLTLLEELIDQGKFDSTSKFQEESWLPRSVLLRVRICNARMSKDEDVWIQAARDYSRMGNVARAFGEASRCAQAFRSVEAAQLAFRLAEAEQNEVWKKKALAIQQGFQKQDAKK